MRSSKKIKAFLGKVGVPALVALGVALFAQVAGAEASIAGPGGKALSPNTVRHGVPGPRGSAPIASAGGHTIAVTTTADGGPGSLRQSIAEAQGGDTIVVPAGTYVLTRGELTIEKALTIAGAGAARTTIDGAGSTRAFRISVPFTSNTPVAISGVTITHAKGSSPLPEFETAGGAAVASFNADLTLRNDVITRNSTKLAGEAFVFGGTVLVNSGRLTMAGTTVSENLTSASGNAAIFAGAVGAEGLDSTLVENSKVIGNRAEAHGREFNFVIGGGMRIVGFGPVLVTGSTISGNVAQADSGEVVAGGLHVIGEPAKLVADQFVSNVADGGSGRAEGGGLSFSGIGGVAGSVFEANRVAGAEGIGGNFLASAGFFLDEKEVSFSHSSILHGIGPAGSENCATVQEATILSKGFNRESTDQCGFHAEGDQVNVG